MSDRLCPGYGKKVSELADVPTDRCWSCHAPISEPPHSALIQEPQTRPPFPKLKFVAAAFAPWVAPLLYEVIYQPLEHYVPALQSLSSVHVLGFVALMIGCPIYAAYLFAQGRSALVRVLGCFLALYLIAVNLAGLITVGGN